MNDDDFLGSSPYSVHVDIGHASDEGKTVIADSSGTILGDLDALAELRDKLAGKFDGREVIFTMHKGTKGIVDSMGGIARATERFARPSFDSADLDDMLRVPHERRTVIQSQQRVSCSELLHIPEDRREEFLDHVKERALQGMLEQADLIGAVTYEEQVDTSTYEKVIVARLKVIIDD